MRIIKTKIFTKWANKNEVLDSSLCSAAHEISQEIYEANYGGGVIKKRVANKGRGKSGSVRTIVAFKKENNCFYVYGFEKSEKSNISEAEEKALKITAKTLFSYTDKDIDTFIKSKNLFEVKCDEQE